MHRLAPFAVHHAIDSPCECEHDNADSLDARLFPSVVLAVVPAVTMDTATLLPDPTHPLKFLPYGRVTCAHPRAARSPHVDTPLSN